MPLFRNIYALWVRQNHYQSPINCYIFYNFIYTFSLILVSNDNRLSWAFHTKWLLSFSPFISLLGVLAWWKLKSYRNSSYVIRGWRLILILG
jgi:hypothetical protein